MLKKIRKIIIKSITCLFFISLMFTSNSVNSMAAGNRYGEEPSAEEKTGYIKWTNHSTVYLDENDNFVWQSNDKVRSNTVHYSTIGFTFSWIRKDVTNPETEENPYMYASAGTRYAKFFFIQDIGHTEEYYYTYNGTEYVTTQWTYSKDEVFEQIKSYSEAWYNELTDKINNGEPCFIGVDCIMQICDHNEIKDEHRYRPAEYNYSNWEEMYDVFTSDKSKVSIPTHFNKFLTLNTGTTIVDDKQEEIKETVNDYYTFVKNKIVNPGTNPDDGTVNPNFANSGVVNSAPKTVTYNDSDKFAVGTAIPADEEYNNHVEVDNWYGNFKIKKVTTQTYTYTFTYSGYWYSTEKSWVWDELPNDDGTGGSGHWYEYELPHSTSGTITRSLSAKEFYEIMEMNLYQLSMNQDGSYSIDVSWGFDGNVDAKYADTVTVPYSVTYCGTSWSTGDDKNQSDVVYSKNTYTKDGYTVPSEYTGHVKVPVIDTSSIYADSTGYRSANDVKNAAVATVNARMDGKEILTTNDQLNLNGVNYLDLNGILNDSTLAANKDSILSTAKTSTGYEIEKGVLDRTTNQSVVHIPVTQANDNYYSTLDTWYKSFVFNKGYKNFKIIDHEGYEQAIKYGYYDNEPIKVQTPVIAPISIDDSGSTFQRGAYEYDVLNLDGTYTVKFDWDDYFAKKYPGYDMPAGFTKYLTKKEVRFAFNVQMKDVSGTEKIYEVGSDGYTQWIQLDDDGSTTEFEIYIPSWTKEGAYQNGVEVRVYANNYLEAGQDAENWKQNEDSSLSDPESKHFYVATYSLPISVQGVMYGFTVTGINDKTTFGSSDSDTYEAGVHQFTRYLHEKTVGIYNRFNVGINNSAHMYIRTLFRGVNEDNGDTRVSNSWSNKDTLPFSAGKSNSSNTLGTLAFGHKIGFAIKTISNLDENAKIDIDASYRWVSNDGVAGTQEIALFYNESKTNALVQYDIESKQKTHSVAIDDSYFDFTYMNDWIDTTASTRGKTTYKVLSEKNKSGYNAAGSLITNTNMLYSGDEDQLAVNENRQGDAVKRYGTDLLTLSDEQQAAFDKSMQTWYGEYCIPSNTKVMDVDKFRAFCAQNGVTEEALSKYGASAPEDLTVDQLLKVYAEDGMSGDEEFWLTDGFLVLNFSIIAYESGSEWGTYYNTYDMWAGEAGTWDSSDHSRTAYAYNLDGNKVPIKVYSGDVAIIDISAGNGFNDRFDAEPLYID